MTATLSRLFINIWLRLAALFWAATILTQSAYACPLVLDKYLDINCNDKVSIDGSGDSITYGTKDHGIFSINGEVVEKDDEGGYPIRLKEIYIDGTQKFRIIAAGDPGARCSQVYNNFRHEVLENKSGAKFADVVYFLCGINDYWLKHPAANTVAVIKKMLRFAKKNAIKAYLGDLTPLHPITRGFQVNWQKSVNKLLESSKLISLQYSDMPLSGLHKDGLHPNAKGYAFMAERVQKHFESNFGNKAKHQAILKSVKLTLDSDGDLLPDKIENLKYGSSPFSADTDSDGLTDFEEVHDFDSDPTLMDSDLDGLGDFFEAKTSHTDPKKADTDKDSLTDSDEISIYLTDPNTNDTDLDGLHDGSEIKVYLTNPKSMDTDTDGLTDSEEIKTYFTNPLITDTDSDGVSDFTEVKVNFTNPLDALSF